jgi:hypothetical protein
MGMQCVIKGNLKESQYNINMENKIEFKIGAKTIISSDISGVDFDLRKGDVITFAGFDEPTDAKPQHWKEMFAAEVKGDISRLKAVMLMLDEEQCAGWFPVDVQTNTILSY